MRQTNERYSAIKRVVAAAVCWACFVGSPLATDWSVEPAADAATAGAAECCTNPADQVWLVSCRNLPMGCPIAEPSLHFWRRDECGSWQPADASAFRQAADPAAVTCVWVHGNRVESGDAGSVGATVYARLAAIGNRPPLRFVVWSWPSERAPGRPVVEARIKLDRTDAVGYYLAWFVDRDNGPTPISLVGYSLGARSVAAALHVLGGGAVAGRSLDLRRVEPTPVQAALVASAIECDAFLPNGRYANALDRSGRSVFVNNSRDFLLAHFELLGCQRRGADAVGHLGLATAELGASGERVEQYDAAGSIGKRHEWRLYFDGGPTLARIRRVALLQP